MICLRPQLFQLQDYNHEIVDAVRTSDLPTLTRLFKSGKRYNTSICFHLNNFDSLCSMAACNRFNESIVHLACRRSTPAVVQFIVTHGGNVTATDDYGRNALHDACWRADPCFDVIALLMDRDADLVRRADKRGASPLQYVRKEHWLFWCAFLYLMKEKYWPRR